MSSPKLCNLVPKFLGERVAKEVCEYLTSQLRSFGCAIRLEPLEDSAVSKTVVGLATYAKSGEIPDSRLVDEMIATVMSAMWGSVMDWGPEFDETEDLKVDKLKAGNLEDEIRLVIYAANTRRRLEQGRHVYATGVAALASAEEGEVWKSLADPDDGVPMLDEWEQVVGWEVFNGSALAWLKARGITVPEVPDGKDRADAGE